MNKFDDFGWIVNDIGELGVRLGDRFIFLYKGMPLEYHSGHDDGTPMLWRPVYEREFGEGCHPDLYHKLGHKEWLEFHKDGDWKEIPLEDKAKSQSVIGYEVPEKLENS